MNEKQVKPKKSGEKKAGEGRKKQSETVSPDVMLLFEQKVTIHCKRLYKYLYGQCKDGELSQDILQETMIQAQKQFTQGLYEEKGLVWFWLQKIAKNKLLGHFRSEARRVERLQENRHQICDNMGWPAAGENLFSDKEKPADPLWESESDDRIRQKVRHNMPLLIETDFKLLSLSESERKLIRERHLQMKTFKELTCRTGEPLSTVMSRYYTIMKKVQRQLIDLESMGIFDRELDSKEMRRLVRENPLEKARVFKTGRKKKM